MNQILNEFLQKAMEKKSIIVIFLQNSVRLVGFIQDFNDYSVKISLHNNEEVSSIVMLNAVSTFSLHNPNMNKLN